ncbi:MAG: hypothetical protein WAS05_09040 [Candidatus Nanopelagicales bacterium]
MTTRSRKARFGIIGAGRLAAAITVGIAAPSQAAEVTTTKSSNSQEQVVSSPFSKSVEVKIKNSTGSNVDFKYYANSAQKSTKTHINAGDTFQKVSRSNVGTDFQSTMTLQDGTTIYIAAKNPDFGKPWVGIGTSSTNYTEYKVNESGDTVEATVDGHTITAKYTDGDYKYFDIVVK